MIIISGCRALAGRIWRSGTGLGRKLGSEGTSTSYQRYELTTIEHYFVSVLDKYSHLSSYA